MPNHPALVVRPHAASILLFEEYDALAMAIGSALRKFAPTHERLVAASLGAARLLSEQSRPELLIMDIDPPQVGLVEFLHRLKNELPATRVLVIGCGTSPKYAASRAGNGALQFLEKPFELADFGAAVRGLLAAESDEDEPASSLADLDLADVIALLCVNGGRTRLQLTAGAELEGELHFTGGHVTHAAAAGKFGESALQEMLLWRLPELTESELRGDSLRNLTAPWDEALARAQPREAGTLRKAIACPAEPLRRRRRTERSGKKILVIDDTELLLIFVEDILLTAEPELQISTAHTGTEGCRRAELSAPDLILLDYSLPDINGDEVCRRLFENEKTALIPIVMMSGHVPEMTATAQRFANVVATISKPFLSHELVTLVAKTLRAGPRAVLEVTPAAATSSDPLPDSPKTTHGNGAAPAQVIEQAVALNPEKSAKPGPSNVVAHEPNAAVATSPGEFATPDESPGISEPTVEARAGISSAVAEFDSGRLVAHVPRISPIAAPLPRASQAPSISVTLPKTTTVLVGLSLRTSSVEMNGHFQIERLRARPMSRTVSLNLPPDSSPLPALLQTGFDIDEILLNAEHQIERMRLVPTRKAIAATPANSRLTIGEVRASENSAAMELTSDVTSAMTIQLQSAFQIVTVELTATFEVSRLLLQSISPRARATLDGSSSAGAGVIFQTAAVLIDAAGQLAEIELRPL